MELGAQNHDENGLSGPNSIMVVSIDPLGNLLFCFGLRKKDAQAKTSDEFRKMISECVNLGQKPC